MVLFAPLTILLGANGAGKSNLIQALLLLQQSLDSSALDTEVIELNGAYVRLGLGRDVLRQGADEEVIEISIASSNGSHFSKSTEYEPDADELLVSFSETGTDFLGMDLTYLNAERVGPRLSQSLSYSEADAKVMDSDGEGALGVLTRHRDEVLP